MPANLTAQYHKAEQAYRQAATPEEELRCLEEMLRELPKHKGTDKLQADLKQKISRAKAEAANQSKSAAQGRSFKLPRQGAGRVVLLGGPNAGKSQLTCTLTKASPDVAEYPFTTQTPSPGMMPWEDVMVQIIDTPPVTADFLEPNTQGLIRGADVVVLMADLGSDDGIEQLQEVLDRFAGGKTQFADESYLDEEDVGVSYTQTFFAPNKIDLTEAADRLALLKEFCPITFREFPISATQGTGLDNLKKALYESLDVVRVYTKMPNKKEADFDKPYTIRRGGTLVEIAAMVHRDFADKLKFARVWGEAVHDGAPMKGDYVLHDKDIVELHI